MRKTDLEKWKTTSSTYLVHDRWMKLRADTCISLRGHTISPFYVMEYNDWVSCLVLSDDDEVTLLRHYRHGIDDYVLEVVGGNIDDNETPEATVRRELEEEIGLKNAAIYKTGVSYANPSSQTNILHCFVALGGTFDGKAEYEPGADFQVIKMKLDEFKEIVENQTEIMQSLHLSAIFFALNYLKNHPRKK